MAAATPVPSLSSTLAFEAGVRTALRREHGADTVFLRGPHAKLDASGVARVAAQAGDRGQRCVIVACNGAALPQPRHVPHSSVVWVSAGDGDGDGEAAARRVADSVARCWRRGPPPSRAAPCTPAVGCVGQLVVFWLRQVRERGTEVAAFDYAEALEELHGVRVAFATTAAAWADAHPVVAARLEARFPLLYVLTPETPEALPEAVAALCHDLRAAAFYTMTSGVLREDVPPRGPLGPDGRVRGTRTLVHAVFASHEPPHGDAFAVVSSDINDRSAVKAPVVPLFVHLPHARDASVGDLRRELRIPADAVVVGNMGGADSFDVRFAPAAVVAVAAARAELHVVLVNTTVDAFCAVATPAVPLPLPPNVHFVPAIVDPRAKQAFFNTCDAFLHARARGETYGLAVGEAATSGLPVLTYAHSPERAHLACLGSAALAYGDAASLQTMLHAVRRRERGAPLPPSWARGYVSRAAATAALADALLGDAAATRRAASALADMGCGGMAGTLQAWAARGVAPRVVYDVGANRGEWAALARVLWPRAYVAQFDAMGGPHVAAAAARGDAHLFHVAVLGAEDGVPATLHVASPESTGNSLYLEATQHFGATSAARAEPVVLRALDALVAERGLPPPDLIKLDVQGAELDVLRGAPRALAAASWLVIEVSLHPWNVGAPLLADVVAAADAAGFAAVELLDTHVLDGVRAAQVDLLFARRGSGALVRRWGTLATPPRPCATASLASLRVARAVWGAADGSGRGVDVTAAVAASLAAARAANVNGVWQLGAANAALGCDPCVGVPKVLQVWLGDGVCPRWVPEGGALQLWGGGEDE